MNRTHDHNAGLLEGYVAARRDEQLGSTRMQRPQEHGGHAVPGSE